MTAPNVALLPVDLADPEGHSWLVAFLTTNRFPFHVTSAPTREGVERRIADGDFSGPAHALFHVEADGSTVGMVALDDLDDGAPLIDVRLAERARGRGLGVPVVRALADTVFARYPDVDRLEAQTRVGTRRSRSEAEGPGRNGLGPSAVRGLTPLQRLRPDHDALCADDEARDLIGSSGKNSSASSTPDPQVAAPPMSRR